MADIDTSPQQEAVVDAVLELDDVASPPVVGLLAGVDRSESTFRAAAALIGMAAFRLTSDIASRSGSSDACCWASSSELSSSLLVVGWVLSALAMTQDMQVLGQSDESWVRFAYN